jgi:pimeloyl-ACP methyl ester carboxylesterase
MKNKFETPALFFVIFCILFFITSCASTNAVKPEGAIHKKSEGKLITAEGLTFAYKFYPTNDRGPTVIYIPGMGGRTTWKSWGEGPYLLAPPLNQANFNFIGFDRAGALRSGSLRDHVKNAQKRGKSGAVTYPTKDGKESAAQNVVRNEIKSIIEFIEKTPSHDPEEGIYLIGGSWGSLISLNTVQSFPDKIKGVVFLSPSINPEFVTIDFEIKYSEYNIDVVNYWKSLVKSFGKRPGLAIGSKTDIIVPHLSKHGSALDSANLLRRDIGTNIEVMEVSTSDHSGKLIRSTPKVKDKIVSWLTSQIN